MKLKPTLVGLALGAWTSACCTTPEHATATAPAPAATPAAPAPEAAPAAPPAADASKTEAKPATAAPAAQAAKPATAPAVAPTKPGTTPAKDAKKQPAKKDAAMTKDAASGKSAADAKAPAATAKVALHASHDHKHGEKCGHEAVKHGDHVDYKHDGHKHQVAGNDVKECQ